MADATPLERDYPDGAAALVVIRPRGHRIQSDSGAVASPVGTGRQRTVSNLLPMIGSELQRITPEAGRAAP